MLDDTQTSMAIYPSNKTISIGDLNSSGINIATNGAAFTTNTIQLGSATTTTKVNGTLSTGNITSTGTITGGTLAISTTNQSTVGNWKFNTNSIGTNTGGTDFALYQLAGDTSLNTQETIAFKKNNVATWTISANGNLNRAGSTTDIIGINLPASAEKPAGIHWRDGFSRILDDGQLRICTDDFMHFNIGCTSNSIGTTKMMINNNGYVGIGTTTPAYTLDVNGQARIGAWYLNIPDNVGGGNNQNAMGTVSNLSHTNMALYQSSGETILNHTTNVNLRISNSDKLSITSSNITTTGCNVGIGTSTPTYLLDVNGAMRCTGDLIVGTNQPSSAAGTYTSGTIRFANTHSDPGAEIMCRRYSDTAGSEAAELVLYQGNDGPGAAGPDRIRLKAPQILFDTFSNGANDPTAVTTQMIIKENGYVGIGTTNPQPLLHVNGTAQLSNYVISSDRRIKTSIADVSQALDLFRTFRPRTYQYKDGFKKNMTYGFVAQEIDQVFPLAVQKSTHTVPNMYSTCPVTRDLITLDTSLLEYDASGIVYPKLKIRDNELRWLRYKKSISKSNEQTSNSNE